MKYTKLLKTMIAGALLAIPVSFAAAADIVHDGIAYSFYEERPDAVYVTFPEEEQSSLVTYEGEIIIPESFICDGKEITVRGIGDNAFKNRTMITSVSLPETITEIGNSSFSNCRRMVNCNLPQSLVAIGEQCFYYCQSLKKVDVPSGIDNIPSYALAMCTALKEVELQGSITKISEYAFFKDSELTSIILNEGLKEIGNQSFADCPKLKDIVFPVSLQAIGNAAFINNISLEQLDFSHLESIGLNAFSGCESLTGIDLSGYKGKSIGEGAFRGCKGVETLILPEIENLPALTFADCSKVEYLELPNGIKSIGDYCFSGCASINKIDIPDNITEIGGYAYLGCSSVVSVEGLDHDMTLGEGAFQGLVGLKKLQISDIKDISQYTFAHCRGLEELEINNGVERIEGGAFTDCPSLMSIAVEGYLPPIISVNSFDSSTEKNATLKVLPDAVSIFAQASQWNRFQNIVGTTDLPWAGMESTVPRFITITGGEISANDSTEAIMVYDIQGRLHGIIEPGNQRMSLPKGLYILKVSNRTIKIKI